MKRRAAALVASTVAALGLLTAWAVTSGGATGPTRNALVAYERAVLPLVQDGGRVVEQGMKPAVNDLQYAHIVPPAVIGSEGDGWVRSLRVVRQKLVRVAPPVGVATVQRTFVTAVDGYIRAATVFAAAARSQAGPERSRRIQDGIQTAQAADRVYNQASAMLQRLRHAVGLPSDPNFPEAGNA